MSAHFSLWLCFKPLVVVAEQQLHAATLFFDVAVFQASALTGIRKS